MLLCRAGWISTLLLELLRNAVRPLAKRTHRANARRGSRQSGQRRCGWLHSQYAMHSWQKLCLLPEPGGSACCYWVATERSVVTRLK